jgi:hypothetical protein
MESPLIVVGLDAADTRLLERWNCENLLLDHYSQIDSMSYSLDLPATLEVWPTIATGLSPDEHGVVLNPDDRPDRSLALKAAAKALNILPNPVQQRLRVWHQERVGTSFPQTSKSHIFDAGAVYNWPGVTPCFNWQEEDEWFQSVNNGEMGEKEFTRRHLGNAGKAIGWLGAMELSGVPIAGAHIHMLDHIGHLNATDAEKLQAAYRQINGLVGWLRQRTDRIVVVSDHGMQTNVTGDPEPGVHSLEGHFATTGNEDLPETVYDVAQWLDSRVENVDDNESERRTSFDAPTEHLEDLGYL